PEARPPQRTRERGGMFSCEALKRNSAEPSRKISSQRGVANTVKDSTFQHFQNTHLEIAAHLHRQPGGEQFGVEVLRFHLARFGRAEPQPMADANIVQYL